MSLHLIPGLGATPALYTGYEFPFPVKRLNYLRPPNATCSFAEYAQLFIHEHGIQAGDSLIGVSLGGMLACEISKWLPIQKLTLISSCTKSQHLHPLLMRLSFLGPILPWDLIRRVAIPVPGLSEERRLAVEMFRESDPVFVRWACSHAAGWDGLKSSADLFSIHGDHDPVFPVERQTVHHVIHGGDHLMVISRQAEILPLLLQRHG